MAKTKLVVTMDAALVEELDLLVAERHFPNRSQAIEMAVATTDGRRLPRGWRLCGSAGSTPFVR